MILLGCMTSYDTLAKTWEPIERFVSEHNNGKQNWCRPNDIEFLREYGIRMVAILCDGSMIVTSTYEDMEYLAQRSSAAVDAGLIFDDLMEETLFGLKYL